MKIRLLKPIGRLAELTLEVPAGGLPLPVDGDGTLDNLEVAALVAKHAGIGRPLLEALSPFDLTLIIAALFAPVRRKGGRSA